MNRLFLTFAIALSSLCLMTETTYAQYGTSNSSSWNSSYSKSWGSSQGLGPNGYFNNNFSREQSQGSMTQNNGYTTPWGGGNRGTTQQWGSQRSSFNNSGWSPYNGSYNNSGGSQNGFNRGRNWNNNWAW
ncbi:hypothetical protein Pla52o_15740 [Novipirellula galeiformis]|uniref:Uncharacterized protein n=1 Tax=Novipirellula galeiformis TaxID=2528004 RepID=A0A5C6CQA6_9BACT|nr:hypothetical protein [Novipirellula galeiformis]TWU25276.1 hypothetical protein Pla52o_15740 [Novipirellula galeiformis]